MIHEGDLFCVAWTGDARGIVTCDSRGWISMWTRRSSGARWMMRKKLESVEPQRRCSCSQTVRSPIATHRDGELVRIYRDGRSFETLPSTKDAIHLSWRRIPVLKSGSKRNEDVETWEVDETDRSVLLVFHANGGMQLWTRMGTAWCPSCWLSTDAVSVEWVQQEREEHEDLSFLTGVTRGGEVHVWVALGLAKEGGVCPSISPWRVFCGVFGENRIGSNAVLASATMRYISYSAYEPWDEGYKESWEDLGAEWDFVLVHRDGLLLQATLHSSVHRQGDTLYRLLGQGHVLVTGHSGGIRSLDTWEGRYAAAVDRSGQVLLWLLPSSVHMHSGMGSHCAPLVCKGRLPGRDNIAVSWLKQEESQHQGPSCSPPNENGTGSKAALLAVASSSGVDVYQIKEGDFASLHCQASLPTEVGTIEGLFSAGECFSIVAKEPKLQESAIYTWSIARDEQGKAVCKFHQVYRPSTPLSTWARVEPPSPYDVVLGHVNGSVTLLSLGRNTNIRAETKIGVLLEDVALENDGLIWREVGQIGGCGQPVGSIAACPGGGRVAVHYANTDNVVVLQAEAASDAIYLYEGRINLERKSGKGEVCMSWLDAGGTYPLLLIGTARGSVQCFSRWHVQLSPYQPWKCLASYLEDCRDVKACVWAKGGLAVVAMGSDLHVLSPHLQLLAGRTEVSNLLPPGKVHKGLCSLFSAASAISGAVPVYFPTVLRKLIIQGSLFYVRCALRCLLHCLQGGGNVMDGVSLESMLQSNMKRAPQVDNDSALPSFEGKEPFTARECKDLNELLEDIRLKHTGLSQVGLQRDALLSLQAITTHLTELDNGCQPLGLDEPGKRFHRIVRAKQLIRKAVTEALGIPLGGNAMPGDALAARAQIGERPISIGMQDAAWAVMSDGDELLLNSCIENQHQMTWEAFEGLKGGFWIARRDFVASKCEQFARLKFAKSRDPDDCVLFYVALKRLNVLQGLYKVSGNRKFVEFFARDFSQEDNRVAALKNAHVLMSQHRYELAAAFFLLGNALDHAVSVLAKNANQMQLAVMICRLWDSGTSPAFKTLVNNLLVPVALEKGDRWLLSILYSLQGDVQRAASCIGRIDVHNHESCRVQKGDEFAADYCTSLQQFAYSRISIRSLKKAMAMAALRAAYAWEAYGIPLQALETLSMWKEMSKGFPIPEDLVDSPRLTLNPDSPVHPDAGSGPGTPRSFQEEVLEAEAAFKGYMEASVRDKVFDSWQARLAAACLTRPYATGRVGADDVPESVIKTDVASLVASNLVVDSHRVSSQVEKFKFLLQCWKVAKVQNVVPSPMSRPETLVLQESRNLRAVTQASHVHKNQSTMGKQQSTALDGSEFKEVQGTFGAAIEISEHEGELLYALCKKAYEDEILVSSDTKGILAVKTGGDAYSQLHGKRKSNLVYGKVWKRLNWHSPFKPLERALSPDILPDSSTICSRSIHAHPLADFFATGSAESFEDHSRCIYLWQCGLNAPVQRLMLPTYPGVHRISPAARVRFDDHGNRLGCISACGHLVQWGIANSRSFSSSPLYMHKFFKGSGRDLAFIDGHTSLVAVAGSADEGCTIKLLDLFAPPGRAATAKLEIHGGEARCLEAWSEGGIPHLASGGSSGMIMVHDLRRLDQPLWTEKSCDHGKVTCLSLGRFYMKGRVRGILAYGTLSGGIGILESKNGMHLQEFHAVHERRTFLNPRGNHALTVQAVTGVLLMEDVGLVTCGGDGFVKLLQHK